MGFNSNNNQNLLSKIATNNGHGENSPYFDGWKAYDSNPYHPTQNPNGVIQMGLAENEKTNWLKSHPEIFNPIVKQTGGTCFAVAALTLCEVMYALQYGEKIQLSIEDILNSFHKGQVRDVLQYVNEHGVSLQIPTGQKLYIDSFTYCERMNENDVLKELDMHPVCGVIRSSSCLKKLKPGEIYQGSESSNGPLHALLIVGYGSYSGVNFYLVRNSWGTTWCSDGYGMNPNSMFV